MRKKQKRYRICQVYKACNGVKQLKEHENLQRNPTNINHRTLWSFPLKIICHRRRGGTNLTLAVNIPYFVALTPPSLWKLVYSLLSANSGSLLCAILKGLLQDTLGNSILSIASY